MSLLKYLKFYSEFKSLCNKSWYIYNDQKVIYLVIYNDIIFIKYHIGYSDEDHLLIYKLDYDDFAIFKKELAKKKNTVNIHINSNYQLYLCDKTKLFKEVHFCNTDFHLVKDLKHINSNIQYSNYIYIDPLFINNNTITDSKDLGNFSAYEIDPNNLVSEKYIHKIFNAISLDEIIWEINYQEKILRISNLDKDLQIYLKLIVKY